MNRHQVLTGAANFGDRCFAVGNVEGIHFTAYASGCNIVILSSDFQRVQIIPGAVYGSDVQVTCVSCCSDVGKIAASYGKRVCIFEPTPLLHHDSVHKLDYRWYHTGTFQAEYDVLALAWNIEGSRLLTAGEKLNMWQSTEPTSCAEDLPTEDNIEFYIEEKDRLLSATTVPPTANHIEQSEPVEWTSIWHCKPAAPVTMAKFSSDGLLFATAGKDDRLVKIWYENKSAYLPLLRTESMSPKKDELSFSFIYIAHPRAVTGFSWRRTSKYMQKGSIANMLLTSSKDNICRVWAETVLPENGLIDMQQRDPGSVIGPMFHTQRHKKRFIQRLQQIRHIIHHKRRAQSISHQGTGALYQSQLSSTGSPTSTLHELHKYGAHSSSAMPALHFHLAASINSETDVPLIGPLSSTMAGGGSGGQANGSGEGGPQFVVHWLDNKEIHMTMEAERIIREISLKTSQAEQAAAGQDGVENGDGGASDESGGGTNVGSGVNTPSGVPRHVVNGLSYVSSDPTISDGNKVSSSGAPSGRVKPHSIQTAKSVMSFDSERSADKTETLAAIGLLQNKPLTDPIDAQIENLIRDWHQGVDMLFSIHPADGSFLVWLIDYLDEPLPGAFRQATVSFSSLIPNAFPLSDALTMAAHLWLYCDNGRLDFRSFQLSPSSDAMMGSSTEAEMKTQRTVVGGTSVFSAKGKEGCFTSSKPSVSTGPDAARHLDSKMIPNVMLLTKHVNGSLNLWKVTFAEKSRFASVVSVSHASRACGHRFHANSAACHPVLPLLLTTAHHDFSKKSSHDVTNHESSPMRHSSSVGGFCSELILWRVSPVGPLSKSGGITELARINSPICSAFLNVAWLPTLLPSSSLGVASNSPSALFVASDGVSLRVYQAVLDARVILKEQDNRLRKLAAAAAGENADEGISRISSASSGQWPDTKCESADIGKGCLNIVSLQSTARPGCVIELVPIAHATHDWNRIQLLHVFQEQLMTGSRSTHYGLKGQTNMEAIVNLQNVTTFEEKFYLVLLERDTAIVHMWKIIIASQGGGTGVDYTHDTVFVQEEEEEGESSHLHSFHPPHIIEQQQQRRASCVQASGLHITTTKVSTQVLPLSPGVTVTSATVAAGHLSSSSIYPACFAPYLISTACSDGRVRFWRCETTERAAEEDGDTGYANGADGSGVTPDNKTYEWKEWEMMIRTEETSTIRVKGQVLSVSCAYSGRVAVAYRAGGVKHDSDSDPLEQFKNLKVAIYECESTGRSIMPARGDLLACLLSMQIVNTGHYSAVVCLPKAGGSEWKLDDMIELTNINIPDPKIDLDLSLIFDHELSGAADQSGSSGVQSPMSPTFSGVPSIVKNLPSVPSSATIQSVRRHLSTRSGGGGAVSALQPRLRHLIHLDWVSTEDGSHVLTVGIGPQVLLYAAVSSEMAAAMLRDERDQEKGGSDSRSRGSATGGSTANAPPPSRGILQKTKSMAVNAAVVQVLRWVKLRSIDLTTADGLAPLPMHISWVRNGILVVGMDNEMHVYSQWKSPSAASSPSQPTSIAALPPATPKDPEDSALDTRRSSVATVSGSNFLAAPSSTRGTMSKSVSTIKLDASILNLSLLADKDRRKDLTGASVAVVKAELPKSESMTWQWMMDDCGLFEAARLANPILPQYHPKQLIELLNFGKIRRVKAILSHLVRCIAGERGGAMGGGGAGNEEREASTMEDEEGGSGGEIEAAWQRSGSARSRGVSIAPGPVQPAMADDGSNDYVEISSIPPLPLYALLAADNDVSFAGADAASTGTGQSGAAPGGKNDTDYMTLFGFNNTEDSSILDDPFDDSDPMGGGGKTTAHRKAAAMAAAAANPNYFSPAQADRLARHLTRTQLPGMSSLDQMYLLALAQTVANTKADCRDIDDTSSKNGSSGRGEVGPTEAAVTEMIDDCGLRFLLAARHNVYLLNTLPLRQRVQLQQYGLSPSYFIWAFHSESEEEMLNSLPCMQKGCPTWAELRQFGAGWWLRNINTLTRCIEKVAKSAFQASKDPLDASLFYLAMKKQNVLWGLFRSLDDVKMAQFFKNNFEEDRWRKAALKNAFALLGKQKFQRAAAFFLLGGAVKDAIEVCLNKLDDFQLALVILRLYEGDRERDSSKPSSFLSLLYEECLGCDSVGKNYDPSRASPDPFIRSMSYWIVKDYSAALGTLLETDIGEDHRRSSQQMANRDLKGGLENYSTNPSVFNFYNYLRTHPLLVRQHLATTAADNAQTVLLSGFSYGATASAAGDKNVTYIDRITPVERRLYFMTAHEHFKNGCPALALEVLTKLPDVIDTDNDITKSRSADNVGTNKALVRTGTLDLPDLRQAGGMTGAASDWSQPVSTAPQTVADLDWSQPARTFVEEKLDLTFSSSGEEDEEEEGGKKKKVSVAPSGKEDKAKDAAKMDGAPSRVEKRSSDVEGDIMAHQLKFIACIKIIVDELSTLATGFEVDGGQLRFQLYMWLEKEVEVLRKLCGYGSDVDAVSSSSAPSDLAGSDPSGGDKAGDSRRLSISSFGAGSSSILPAAIGSDVASMQTLHEVILAEKMDFEAKLSRMERRKRWLKANQLLLRTLMSYSVLHGSRGGGLASVRMELLLLLQELQQEKTRQQLLSPLPFPTTLPLLSASVASANTVIADPIQYLQNMCQDLLHNIVELTLPPGTDTPLSKVFLLRNISAALSACIYQCLCDSESFIVATSRVDVGMEGFTSMGVVYKDSHLMTGTRCRRRMSSGVMQDVPTSLPSKWPGVSSLINLMDRKQDNDSPKLSVLLCESLIAVHMSLLSHAMAMYDANVLYRLVGHPLVDKMWPTLYGGGVKKLVQVATSTAEQPRSVSGGPAIDESQRQRLKLHSKVMGSAVVNQKFKENRPTYREKFVSPVTSMVSHFMTKLNAEDHPGIDYDSAEEISSNDEDEENEEIIGATRRNECSMNEHLDPHSYSWCLMRYAIVKYIRHTTSIFLPKIGVDLSDLPTWSPLINNVLKNLELWEDQLRDEMEEFSGPPTDFIPGCYVDGSSINGGVSVLKYHTLMDPANTPFRSSHYSSRPAKRLWHYLVTRDYLQDVFIRYVFRKRRSPEEMDVIKSGTSKVELEPMKIVHKEQEILSCFCINQANLNCIVVATQKEIVEMDISRILSPPEWIKDENGVERDIEVIRNPISQPDKPEEFLVVRAPYDSRILGGAGSPASASTPISSNPGNIPGSQTVHGGTVSKAVNIPGINNSIISYYIIDRSRRLLQRLSKRSATGVRRMAAHPLLPYYLTGSQDGCVRLWEWGRTECVSELRKPGAFPKVTKVLFNAHGNKFGVSDTEGAVGLWQVNLGLNVNKPYLSLKCHSKVTSDFVFVGSSSLIATAGHSADNRNVCIWDTLLPQRKALVQGFHCHIDGCPSVLYAPQHQVLISGGKKGEICIFDVRQRQLRHTFQAHDTPIKCMTLDMSTEECFVTGSADGDIKVWGLAIHNLMYTFPGEHSKTSSLFRNSGSAGVTQLLLSPDGHLFSCGTDGSLKVRHLAHKQNAVLSL